MSKWTLCGLSFAALLAVCGPAEAMQCHGTEPFWDLTIDRAAMVLHDADGVTRRLTPVGPQIASARPADLVRVYQTATVRRPRVSITIVVRRDGTCSDGMSDTTFAYNVVVIRRTGVIEGCCD
jgi:uncharacterized membrane protein